MQAKKSLGQNFLKSNAAVESIVSAGEITANDTVLEIGPGTGMLTRALLKAGARVVAIEKDDRLVIPLSHEFDAEIKKGRFVLIHGDVLDFVYKNEMSPLLAKELGAAYKVIANIPYYITGEIIERFHTVSNNPVQMVLLVQKEVAERIIALNKKESILSIAVKMYGEPKIVRIVPRGSFAPAPKVDSAVLSIRKIRHFGNFSKEEEFFTILHAAFLHKRKFLLSNLKSLPSSISLRVSRVLSSNNILLNARAEDIPIEVWKKVIQ